MRLAVWLGVLLLFMSVLLLAPGQPVGARSAQEDRPRAESPQAGDSRAGDSQEDPLPDAALSSGPPQKIVQPLDMGLQEEAGVTLLILDVKVRDKKGRPVRGLSLADFEVIINGRLWPLVAVDDFCDCAASEDMSPRKSARRRRKAKEGQKAGTPLAVVVDKSRGETTGISVAPADPPAATLAQHFVIYLDFSELHHTGRVEAEHHARRWIEEGMRPGDRVMLAGFSTAAGLVVITSFTSDRAVLLKALEAAFTDKALVDTFALLFPRRLDDCLFCMDRCRSLRETCILDCCLLYARDDASQGRRSLEALELFITTLEDIPGRKNILYFNQNSMLYPEQVYAGMYSLTPGMQSMQSWSIQDNMRLMSEVAATATANRTAINVATMPGTRTGVATEAATLGMNMADFSGGIANRHLFDLDTTLDLAGRECCMYRLSVQIPEDPPRRTLRAKVAVRGRMLPASYRVRFFTPQERWFRHARLALLTTSRSSDTEVQLALLPLGRSQGLWRMEAQVALALKDLFLVPGTANRTGRWRVGALLNREDGDKAWEMLTLAQATLQGKGDTRIEALHSRKIDALKPGVYRLRAFLEDAELNRFWSREVTLALPGTDGISPEDVWLSSPVMARWVDSRLNLDLAPVTKNTPVSSMVSAPVAGFIPMNDAGVGAGTILEFRSMYCPGPQGDTAPATESFLLHDEQPPLRLPAATIRKAGDCLTLVDTMDTFELIPGDYTYRLMVKRGEQAEPLLREVDLTIWE